MKNNKKYISIVIPAYNEGQIINEVLLSVVSELKDFVNEIIVVDDGSIDDTSNKANVEGVKLIKHKKNLGYGAALKTGILESNSQYVLMMDSDGQHSVSEIKKLINELGKQDAVIGSRKKILHSSLWRMPGKWLLVLLAQFLIGKKIPDLNSGLRIVKKKILLKYMDLCPQGFSFSTTITMVLLSRGYEISYIPIEINKRIGKSSVNIKAGLDTIILILRLTTLFNPLKIFLPTSFLFLIVGASKFFINYFSNGPITTGSLLTLMVGLLIFSLGLLSDQISQLRLEQLNNKK